MKMKTIRKPDPFDVALYGLIVAAIVALIYFFQLRTMLESNRISREALEAVQRAFVGFTGFQSERRVMWTPELRIGSEHKLINGQWVDVHTPEQVQPEGHQPYWFIYGTFANSGNTPANNVVFQVFTAKRDSEPSQEPFKMDVNRPVDTLAPKTNAAVSSNVPAFDAEVFLGKLDEQDLSKTFVNPNFFAWGWAIYSDSFPKTELHVTEFCGHLHGIRNAPSKGLELIFTNCKSRNCADRQCPDYEQVVETFENAKKPI